MGAKVYQRLKQFEMRPETKPDYALADADRSKIVSMAQHRKGGGGGGGG